MSQSNEFWLDLGPVQILRCGPVWALDLFRLRLYGVGAWPRGLTIIEPSR